MSTELSPAAEKSYLRSQAHFDKMDFTARRELVLRLSNGHDPDGRKWGIFVTKTGNGWACDVRGAFSELFGGTGKNVFRPFAGPS